MRCKYGNVFIHMFVWTNRSKITMWESYSYWPSGSHQKKTDEITGSGLQNSHEMSYNNVKVTIKIING